MDTSMMTGCSIKLDRRVREIEMRDGYDVEMQEGTMHDVALCRSSGCKVPELVSVVLHHQPKWRATRIISKREQPHT